MAIIFSASPLVQHNIITGYALVEDILLSIVKADVAQKLDFIGVETCIVYRPLSFSIRYNAGGGQLAGILPADIGWWPGRNFSCHR